MRTLIQNLNRPVECTPGLAAGSSFSVAAEIGMPHCRKAIDVGVVEESAVEAVTIANPRGSIADRFSGCSVDNTKLLCIVGI